MNSKSIKEQQKTEQLVKVWSEHWQNVQTDEEAQDKITQEIDMCRKAVLEIIRSLH